MLSLVTLANKSNGLAIETRREQEKLSILPVKGFPYLLLWNGTVRQGLTKFSDDATE
jgi:hypothetical protein